MAPPDTSFMDLLRMNLATFILHCIWQVVHYAGYVNPHFKLTFAALDVLAAVYFLARIRFAPGLWAQLRSPFPPTVDWFKSLPQHIPRNAWGVYVVILEMDGCIPLIYIGSGTAFDGGVLSRTRCYWKRRQLPKNIKKALKSGYQITNIRILGSFPTPLCGDFLDFRTLAIAVEAVLATLFSAFVNRNKSYGLPNLCRWRGMEFEYLGLCSHSPLLENVYGADTSNRSTGVETQRMRRERKALGKLRFLRKLKANNPLEYIRQLRIRAKKQAPVAKAKRKLDKEAKKWHCAPCSVNASTKADLESHLSSNVHAAIVQMGGVDANGYLNCPTCPNGFRTQTTLAYGSHIRGKGHKEHCSTGTRK